MSQETANLLTAAGKGHWLKQREGPVFAKGKGTMTTFWVKPSSPKPKGSERNMEHSSYFCYSNTDDSEEHEYDSRHEDGDHNNQSEAHHLVHWNTENAFQLLADVDLWRNANPVSCRTIEESMLGNPASLGLSENMDSVKAEVEVFISNIASFYHDHPFHNFLHASNVAMSVVKMLSGIESYTNTWLFDAIDQSRGGAAQALCVSPISRLACLLAAIVHGVEHTGVPNAVAVGENEASSYRFNGRSLSQQLSFERCWNLLQEARFKILRAAIFRTPEEESRFREELLFCVIATDLVDEESNETRRQRWEKAFIGVPTTEEAIEDLNDRKALLLMEYIVQASSVVHAMQHWEVYSKWSSRHFVELYNAYADGRTSENPQNWWYETELHFFEEHVIPLTNRLSESGAFTKVFLEPYQSYAKENCREWECNGENLVVKMTDQVIAETWRGRETGSRAEL